MAKLDPTQIAGGGAVLAMITALSRKVLNVSKITLRLSTPEADARIAKLEAEAIADRARHSAELAEMRDRYEAALAACRNEITDLRIQIAKHERRPQAGS